MTATISLLYPYPPILRVFIHSFEIRPIRAVMDEVRFQPESTNDAKIRDEDYRSALRIALNHIVSFGADTIVIALGLDAAISDPFEGLSITTEGFGKLQMIFPNWNSYSR